MEVLSYKQFTGFYDIDGKEIYNGDLLYDSVNDISAKSKLRVFWSQGYGQWRLDCSYHQDQTYSSPLYKELSDFKYKKALNEEGIKHKF